MSLVVNFIVFQIGWLACVIGGAQLQPWFGTLFVLAAVAVHLGLAAKPVREVQLLLLVAVIGAVWDSLLVALGLAVYPSGTLIAGTAPYWIVAMWLLFATTLNLSLRWLKDRPLLAVMFGAVGGPLAYYAGSRLGGVYFPEPVTALITLSIGWAVILPILMQLSQRFNGIQQMSAPTLADEGLTK